MLVVEHGKDVFTYLFDAKYRIGERDGKDASPAEPINDMHRYRDAILYRSQEGDHKLSRQIVGAYVLYPGRPLPQSYNYEELIQNENIGAIPLLPGEDGGSALKSFIGEILGKKTPESHLSADIPTRGTTVVVAPSEAEYLATDVVYGTYRNSGGFNQLEWIKKKHLYNMPLDKAEEIGIADEASAKAKSMLFLVSSRKEKPSVFRIKRGSATKVKRSELEQKGYPKESDKAEKEYWLWELEDE